VLFYLIAWALLFFSCLTIGTAVLRLTDAHCFDRRNDRLIIAIWLGLVILAIGLLGLSLVLPLSPIAGLGTVLFLVGLAIGFQPVRLELKAYYQACSRQHLSTVALVAIGVAAFSTREIAWFDTGLYHYGVIRWLSEFGTVPGFALINARFGFTSAWFALLAPFNHGFLTAQTSAVANSFVFTLAICQLITSLPTSRSKTARLADRFITFFLLITLPIAFVIKFPWLMTVSTAPDLPLILLVGIMAWAILLMTRSEGSPPVINPPETNPPETLHPVRLIPIILAVGAMSIKLNGIVLVPVASLFYLAQNRLTWQRIAMGLGFPCVLLAPMFLYGYLAIGFPLFPSTLFRINFPWTMQAEVAQTLESLPNPWVPTDTELSFLRRTWEWLVAMSTQWLVGEKLNILIPLMLVVAVIAGIQILQGFRQQKWGGRLWLLLIAAFGIGIVMLKSPLMRHGLGYFAVLPAYLLADQGLPQLSFWQPNLLQIGSPRLKQRLKQFFSLSWLAVLICSIVILVKTGHGHSLWLPSRLPRISTHQAQVNDVIYYYPTQSSQCWAEAIPCSPGPIQQDIQLRDPAKGIGGGFVYRASP